MNDLDNIFRLIKSGKEENIELGFTLAKSQGFEKQVKDKLDTLYGFVTYKIRNFKD